MSQDEEGRDQPGLGSERFWKSPNTLDALTPEERADQPPIDEEAKPPPVRDEDG